MTFREGPIDGVVVRELKQHTDARGWLMELFRSDELPANFDPAMAYVSGTMPGMARGPHEHRDQADCLCFVGPSLFRVYLWDARAQSPTFGSTMKFETGLERKDAVVVPAGVVHAYKNIGTVEGWVFNCPNRLYAGTGRKEPVDEIRHELTAHSHYHLD